VVIEGPYEPFHVLGHRDARRLQIDGDMVGGTAHEPVDLAARQGPVFPFRHGRQKVVAETGEERPQHAAAQRLEHLAARTLRRRPARRIGHRARPCYGRCRSHQRSTSPNTMSSEPRTAETSASMWPRHMKSMACRWAKPGALILQRYGLLVPSDTR